MEAILTYQNDTYLTLRVNEPGKVMNFLSERMGFTISRTGIHQKNKSLANLKCITLRNSYGNNYLLPINNNKNSRISKSISNKAIVVNTDDCLRDYYNLRKAEEIIWLSDPKYMPEGLIFEVLDKWENRYILIEKRNYTDS